MKPLSVLASLFLLTAMASPPAPAGEAAPAGTAVLNAQSFWRCHLTWKTEMVRTEAGELGPVEVAKGKPARVIGTALPPADWAAPGFDDSGWGRLQAPIQSGRGLALACLRGRFEVKDPAAAGAVQLDLAFRGGAVVYLNGQEIARGNMTGEKGKADLEALAEDYPKEAYVDPKGMVLLNGFGDPTSQKDRFALRDRKLTVKLPGELLRKGVNMLALELHRAPTNEVIYKGKAREGDHRYRQWSMLELQQVSLTAPAGAALVPNVGRPAGFRVWDHSVITAVGAGERGDPNEPVGAAQIVGCRNGAFSAQLVAGSTEAIKGIKAEPSALKGPGGAEIPASAVQVRWPRAIRAVVNYDFGIEALETAPPAEVPAAGGGALQPIFITVNVPKDAKPGDYTGKLAISTGSGAAPVEAPVRVKIVDYTLPDSKDYCSHAGLVQSPDSLAIQYNVPLWSEAHWKLIDQSFTLLAQAGAREVFIPLICETYHGNEQTMVRWIKKEGAGVSVQVSANEKKDGSANPDTRNLTPGAYSYDYSIAEKYLDLALKRLGKVSVVSPYIWDRQGVFSAWSNKTFEQSNPARVSLLDPASGKVERLDAPKWGAPESAPFWKPVIDGMRERLKARGLESAMMLGVVLDARPLKVTLDDLAIAAPGTKYMVVSHMGYSPESYHAHVWGAKGIAQPEIKRPYEAKNPIIYVSFPRDGSGGVGSINGQASPIYRVLMESNLCAGNDGIGWVGAEFWPCRKDPKGRPQDILGGAEVGNVSVPMHESSTAVLAPGAAGPIATLRFEMLREGVQDTQAAMLLARALQDPAQKAKLGDDLAKRAEDVLFERALSFCRRDFNLWVARPWQMDSEKLYTLAGQAAAKLGLGK